MAIFDLPELPETRATPHLMLGAASPLWSYYGAAAAGGVAYWWMTRWMQPVNLEGLFGAITRPQTALAPLAEAMPLFEAMAEPAVEALELMAEATEAVVEVTADALAEALPEAPVGGEAAPFSPLVEALETAEPEAALEPAVEAAPEPVLDVAPEPVVVVAPELVALEPAPEPMAETPPMIEATADPQPAPVARPRVRKTPPANGLEA